MIRVPVNSETVNEMHRLTQAFLEEIEDWKHDNGYYPKELTPEEWIKQDENRKKRDEIYKKYDEDVQPLEKQWWEIRDAELKRISSTVKFQLYVANAIKLKDHVVDDKGYEKYYVGDCSCQHIESIDLVNKFGSKKFKKEISILDNKKDALRKKMWEDIKQYE